ncbi:endoribonuclease MazF [Candidatus Kaiserbacteria bacterium]|nr:endoribonuclease MazF [Candidatus Kaiserbacteria bacterium]
MVARRAAYAPERGDIVWLDFNHVRGHEQSGRRPALVLSPRAYNKKSGLALVCPITSHAKGYPFEVALKTRAVQGVILADQVRGVDWKERRAEKAGTAPESSLREVQEYVQKLVIFKF